MCEDLLHGYYSLPFELSGKGLLVISILLFFAFILYTPKQLFMSGTNKKSFKRNKSVVRKCCLLKALKVFLMYLFVTLFINKQNTGSDN